MAETKKTYRDIHKGLIPIIAICVVVFYVSQLLEYDFNPWIIGIIVLGIVVINERLFKKIKYPGHAVYFLAVLFNAGIVMTAVWFSYFTASYVTMIFPV